jgi:hypothetical protein
MQMDRDRLLQALNDALSLEEVPILAGIYDLERLVELMSFDTKTKGELLAGLGRLRTDSARHAMVFSELSERVLRGELGGP